MTDRLAVDTNAVVHALRGDRPIPPPLTAAREVFLPLPDLAELHIGVLLSDQKAQNRVAVENLTERWTLLTPDRTTALSFAELSATKRIQRRSSLRHGDARRNDLWIAALCVQHRLPLLTNDRDFDDIEGLEVIHW